MEEEKEFIEYLKDERKQFANVVSKYEVRTHRTLRTQVDNFLIAYDQAVERLTLLNATGQKNQLLAFFMFYQERGQFNGDESAEDIVNEFLKQ